MKLYTYFRSSAAYRVRIALALKGIAAEEAYIHLRKKEQSAPAYLAVNPMGFVPALEDEGEVLTQSLAIIEYLDETHPEPPLLPGHPADRAKVRALAQTIACDIHPLNNLRVLRYLTRDIGLDEARLETWYNHWITEGFRAVETMLTAEDSMAGRFCHGDEPTLADICLVPQIANAERYKLDLSPYPTIRRIGEAAAALPAFSAAHPSRQKDAE